jgi:phosphoglycolate phosphatase-like HAD superfamily hydrolase
LAWTGEGATPTVRAMRWTESRVARLIVLTLMLIALGCSESQKPRAKEASTGAEVEAAADPLPSWNDTAAKARIMEFVQTVTDPDDPGFVEPSARVASFDNDGTLWVEQPMYAEMAFAIDRVVDLAKVHPEWKTEEPFRTVLEGNIEALVTAGPRSVIEVVMASHTGMSTTLFDSIATEWVRDALHPDFEIPYTDLAYQPQLELLRYLEANGFTNFIVSGGTVEFIRVFSHETYGIPPQRVVGSSVETRYEVQGGKPSLLRLPQVDFIDDKGGKPVGIHKHIARRPILAFGNSDGDFEMLQYTTMGSGGTRLGLLLHHDDAEREYAYDRNSKVGTLDKALDAANSAGWVVVSMKNDWNSVFVED